MVQLLSEVRGSGVAGDLVMLDPLGRADQREIGRGVFLFLPSSMTSWPSSTRPIMPLQGLARGGFAEQCEAFVEALDWASVSADAARTARAAARSARPSPSSAAP